MVLSEFKRKIRSTARVRLLKNSNEYKVKVRKLRSFIQIVFCVAETFRNVTSRLIDF